MLQMPPICMLCMEDKLCTFWRKKPSLFSQRYQKELMNYLHKLGGSIGMGQAGNNLPSFAERDVNDGVYIPGARSYNGEHPNHGIADESNSN
jgi:hypothetical protein